MTEIVPVRPPAPPPRFTWLRPVRFAAPRHAIALPAGRGGPA